MNNEVRARDLLSWLHSIDEALASNPADLTMQYERGTTLDALGRYAEAAAAFEHLLNAVPQHFWAHILQSNALAKANDVEGALGVAQALVALYPNIEAAHVTLGRRYREAGFQAESQREYIRALLCNPRCRDAHVALADSFADADNRAQADAHRQAAHALRYVTSRQYRGTRPALPLLLIVSNAEDRMSIHFERHLDTSIFLVSSVAADDLHLLDEIPPTVLIVNGIGDADIASDALTRLEAFLPRLPVPIINAPTSILGTGRVAITERLGKLPHVRTPRTKLIPRTILEDTSDVERAITKLGFTFPVLLRTPGFQAGRLFTRIDAASDVARALAETPGDELFLIEYIDVRDPSGAYRKYRVLTIDGKLYPLHMALSSSWKVHYFSSDMAINPAFRASEAAFLENMANELGPIVMSALEAIDAELALDYGGIDFTVHNGEVLVFEANPAMTAARPVDEPHWHYRIPAADAVFAAILRMLLKRLLQTSETSAAPPA